MHPLVSIRFSPAGRTYSFLVPELDLDRAEPLAPGEQVVVQTSAGPAMATVTRAIPPLAARKPAADDARVLRRATRDDLAARSRQELSLIHISEPTRPY